MTSDVVFSEKRAESAGTCAPQKYGVARFTYSIALDRELNPVGTIENLIARDVARRATQMEMLDEVLVALQQQAGFALANLGMTDDGDRSSTGVILATIAASDRLNDVVQLGLKTSRGMYRALDAFFTMQGLRRRNSDKAYGAPDDRFATEEACISYLVRRFRTGEVSCPKCKGAGVGSWIPSRLCWQCGECKTQSGIRSATVMSRSPIELAKWFHAVKLHLVFPELTSHELAEAIKINRAPTIRAIAKRIRAAMCRDDASSLLAGLDRVFLPN